MEIPCDFPLGNQVFQRPCRSVLLPSYCFTTIVVNEYDRSIFNMIGSLRPKYPPSLRDRCGNTPVALCFLWRRRLLLLHPHLGRDMGGAKRMGGGKRTRERALPKIFGPLQKSFWSALSWIFVQEKQSIDTWGGWKTYRMKGGPKPFFGRVSFVRFSTPLLFPPPHGVLWPTSFRKSGLQQSKDRTRRGISQKKPCSLSRFPKWPSGNKNTTCGKSLRP